MSISDLYITPYLFEEGITSGTLTFGIISGIHILSSKFPYAVELLRGRGYLINMQQNLSE